MTRRIVRTTRRIQYNAEGEPIETVVSTQEQQPADPSVNPAPETVYEPAQVKQRVTYTYPSASQPIQETQVYDPDTGAQQVTYSYPVPTTATQVDLVEPQWSRTLRRVTERQLQALRSLDMRISNLETLNERDEASYSFERSTWWALWGLLMLLLGGALIVILFLVISALAH